MWFVVDEFPETADTFGSFASVFVGAFFLLEHFPGGEFHTEEFSDYFSPVPVAELLDALGGRFLSVGDGFFCVGSVEEFLSFCRVFDVLDYFEECSPAFSFDSFLWIVGSDVFGLGPM